LKSKIFGKVICICLRLFSEYYNLIEGSLYINNLVCMSLYVVDQSRLGLFDSNENYRGADVCKAISATIKVCTFIILYGVVHSIKAVFVVFHIHIILSNLSNKKYPNCFEVIPSL